MMTSPSEACAVCAQPANERCSRCHVTAYCSRGHQRDHWKQHKAVCRPYVVQDSPVLGRHLVASKDLLPGEVVLKDVPLVLGPRQITMPVCVSCSSSVNGSVSCTECGWPLCAPECQQVTLHRPECLASRARGSKVVISKFFQLNEMYECIMPLRCLWLKDNEPKKWKEVISMVSHLEDRQKSKAAEMDKSNVIDFIRGYLKYQNFSDEDAYNVCGILEVNGFEIPAPNFIGLYGQACLLEHTCVPNTSRTFDPQMNVIVRAAVPIKKGDHITTSYTDPMWGTASRQLHLNTTKYFTCQCNRCQDPTELGTHFSSIKCQNCSELILPPAVPGQPWTCGSCSKAVGGGAVNKLLKTYGEILSNLRGNMVDSEDFLKMTVDDFSENHHYRSDVKLALVHLIGKQAESQPVSLNELQLKRKLQLCQEVLALADRFLPGLTRLRGILLFERAMTQWDLHKMLDKAARTARSAASMLKDIEQSLQEAHTILSFESPLQDEHKAVLLAAEVLPLVAKSIKKCKGNKK